MQVFCSCSGRVTTALGAQTLLLRTQPICRIPHSTTLLSDRVYQLQSGHHGIGSCCAAQRRQSVSCQSRASTDHQQGEEGSSAGGGVWQQHGIAAAMWSLLLGCGPALAEADTKYNPTQGSESVKSIAGVFYAGLLAVFAFRLLTRRAKKFKEERIASAPAEDQAAVRAAMEEEDGKVVTPLRSLWAAIRLGVFAYLLFLVSSNVDGYFEGQALPDQLTARNITITLRTVVRGLSYLMTFLFAANTVGLTALTVQLLINPEAGSQPTVVKATEVVEDITQGGSDPT